MPGTSRAGPFVGVEKCRRALATRMDPPIAEALPTSQALLADREPLRFEHRLG